MSQYVHAIWTKQRELVAARVTQEEIYRLRGLTENGRAPYLDKEGRPETGPALIIPHHKINGVWLVAAGVSVAVIRAELRRKIEKTVPVAEMNRTIKREHFSNEKGAGQYWAPINETCFNYRTTAQSLEEHEARDAQRVAA